MMSTNNIRDFFCLDGRVALVTGASRGLGSAFALALAEAGADVVICARAKSRLAETAQAVRDRGRKVLEVEADITSEPQVLDMVDQAVKTFGRIDILVNNAATGRMNKPPEKTTTDEWQFVLNINVTGTFLCAREIGKVMKKQKKGKIINLGSMSGSIINKYFHGGSYDVSKSAVSALTRALAVEYAPDNINVIALAPGYYETAPNRRWFAERPEVRDQVIDMIPLGRLGNVRELSGFLVCLASDVTNYMTGSTVYIDGGYRIW